MNEDDNREEFAYDSEGAGGAEDQEGGDESWAAGAEAADEGGDEALDEAVDEAGDEAFDEGPDEATTTLGAIEGDEALDEAADEAFDEAYTVSASTRLRAAEDRNRRMDWARRLASDQRLEAQRASAAQRAIADRIRSIPIQRSARVASVGTLQGAGVVTAILPNGRRSRMRIIPTMAPISEVNRLRTTVIANERRQATAIATNAKAVSSLARAQSAAFKRLTDQQVKSDKDLSRRVVQGDNRLDARITKELSAGGGIIDKHNRRLAVIVKRERRRSMMNNVLLATAIPFFVTYGDRDDVFTVDNGILAGSTAFWLVGDDVLSSWATSKGFAQNLASFWSYTGWLANGATLALIFKKWRTKPTERFIAGVTEVDDTHSKEIDLSKYIPAGRAFDEFKGKQHVVTATVMDGSAPTEHARDARGVVTSDGKLELSIDRPAAAAAAGAPPRANVQVMWMVDTSVAETVQGTAV